MDKGSYDSYSDTSRHSDAAENEPANDPEKEDSEDTALVPKSLFNENCHVGDIYRVRVEAIHDDELEISHVKNKKE